MDPVLYNEFSPQLFQQIESQLDQLVEEYPENRYAAFDADGTLWPIDIGEIFFRFQIEHCGLSLPKKPWHHYQSWKAEGDPREAYLWLAQINAGHSLEKIREWAKACIDQYNPLPFFQSQKKLIELLQKKDFEVFVVTASVKWAVEPAAALLGIDYDHVLGVETMEVDGTLSKVQEGPITWREGKVEKLLLKTNQQAPLLAAGNTTGDLQLLESSLGIKLAVTSAPKEHELYETESQLKSIAIENGWTTHSF